MGFFSDLFGAVGAGRTNFPTGIYQPLPPPPGWTTTTTAQNQYPYVQLNSQAGQLSAITGGLMGAGMSGIGEVYRIDQDLHNLTRYAEMCGDSIEMVELESGRETDDVKVAILKAAEVGKVVKGVGMKLADHRFAVYREQGE